MLFPEQVIALRKRIVDGGKADLTADGRRIVRKSGIVQNWGEVIASEPAGKAVFNPPQFVLGEPEDPACLVDVMDPVALEVPGKVVRVFRDVRIIGWRSILTRDGFYCSANRYINGDEGLSFLENDYEGFVMLDGVLTHVAELDDLRRVSGNTLFISVVEPGNYGSFLIRALPKLMHFSRMGIGIDQIVIPVRSPFLVDALEMLGFGHVPAYTVPEALALEFENVHVIDDFDNRGYMCADAMAQFRSLFGKYAGKERLYVSRRLNGHRPLHRPLLNEAEIESQVECMGFKVIFPESLSFRRQVELFSGAEFIVGPSGSGMLNSLFAKAECKVLDVESFTTTVRQHARVYSSGGHRYAFAFGGFDPEDKRASRASRRWRASSAMVAEGIDRLEAG